MYGARSSIKARPIKLIGFRPVSRNNASGSINISRRFWLLPRFPRPPTHRTAIASCTRWALPSPAGSHCRRRRRRISKTLLFSTPSFPSPLSLPPCFILRSASSGPPVSRTRRLCRDENDTIITRCAAAVVRTRRSLRKSKSDTSVAHRYEIDFWITSRSNPTRYYKKKKYPRANGSRVR